MSEGPISESDLARMFDEEDAAETAPVEIEEPVVIDEAEPEVEVVEPGTEVLTGVETEVEEPEPEPEPGTGDHLEWAARRNLTTFEEAAKLAYEQERFLGRRAGEVQDLSKQVAELESALAEAFAQRPAEEGRSDEWINQALVSPDPARYAFDLAAAGDWSSYERMMQTWEGIVGESVTMNVHQQIMATLQEARAEQESAEPEGQRTAVQAAILDAFALAGIYDLKTDPLNPTINKVVAELGSQHPLVAGATRGDVASVAGLVEIARARTLTTRTLRVTDPEVVHPNVTEEGQSPRRTPPPKNPFGEMEQEWERMGVLPVKE